MTGLPHTLSLLAVGLALTVLAGMAVRWLYREARTIPADEVPRSPPPTDHARMAWRMLKDESVTDGYLLWDPGQRLADYSGLVTRYLPELAERERPTAREVVTALVDSGRVRLPAGVGRDDMIAAMLQAVQTVASLRELHMTDGQVFLGRTIDLGEGHTACVFTNITALKRHQVAQRASEALFRTVFESGPSMMVLLDGEQRPLAVNRAFRTRLGYSLERFAELGWAGILHPEDAADQTQVAPWVPAVKRLIAADGSVLRCEIRFSPVRDAGGRREGRMLVTIEDTTARWETERRVRFQASLLDQVGNAVLAVDRQGRILYGNRAAQTLFQWDEAMMIGAPLDRLLGTEVARAAIAGEMVELESEGRTWAGGRFPAAITIDRTTDDAGTPSGAVLVVTDLTQRRVMDLQLMHSARLATLGEMAASIAHEFNQCLHVIRLASEALRLDVAEGRLDRARFTRRADNILAQVDRLTEMVMQMRTISRRDGEKRPFRPAQALDAALRMVEPLLRADGITLQRCGSLGDTVVLGHPIRLEQVLLNLLNNARDAIHERMRRDGEGGGAIAVRCAIDPAAGRLTITVADDGTGVAADLGETIFEPFVTTKDETRGCGLGLSISRGICVEMGGMLSFANRDRGAEFIVELPLAAGCAPPPEPWAAACPEDGPSLAAEGTDENESDAALVGRPRLLLVDDEALSVMMVGEFLERQGYKVDTAYDGVEALALCGRHVYDAVITDIRMPRMDGRALIAHLAELQPGTPVIVVTGHLKESDPAALGANVQAVLPKPFQLLQLREQLNHLDAPRSRTAHPLVEED